MATALGTLLTTLAALFVGGLVLAVALTCLELLITWVSGETRPTPRRSRGSRQELKWPPGTSSQWHTRDDLDHHNQERLRP